MVNHDHDYFLANHVDGVILKKLSEMMQFITAKNVNILYRFVRKIINLSNKICHTWEGRGCNCHICLITTCLGPMWSTPGDGVLCWNKYTYLYGLPLAERRCESVMNLTVYIFSPRIWGWCGGNVVLE